MVKALGLDIDYVLYDMSHTNLILYGASLPAYRSPRDKGGSDGDECINADDPSNRDRVRAFLNSID